MPSAQPPLPSYPPPGWGPRESDESLAAGIRGGADSEVAQSTTLLIARHWRPVHEYAVICLASSGSVASMLTAAAFHQVLDRLKLGEPGTALRPRLLVTVRDMAHLWSSDEELSGVLPVLRKPAGARGMRSAKSLTPENRVLAERSFQGLPPVAHCVLWHVEVEAEPIDLVAGLLGMHPDDVSAALEQSRDKLREGVVRAHRDLAPNKDCGFYNRLLDGPIRRGGELLPDVRQHLDACRYCRSAAEQLGHFESGLGLLLAEAVLGWGARRYHDTRPGRAGQQTVRLKGSSRHGGRGTRGRRGNLLSRIPSPRRRDSGSPRSPRALFAGVGLASASLLTTLLAAGMWSDDGGGTDPAAATSGSVPGSTDSQAVTASPTAPGTARLPSTPQQTRLRNAAADLCLDIRGEVRAGASVELADCSAENTQQWSYGNDGEVRSAAQPGLCVDSHADAGVVILGTCVDADDARGDDVRYDLTAQGELLPRWDDTLALAPAGDQPGDDVVVKVRDHTPTQRWLTDATDATPGSLSITGTDAPPSARPIGLPGGTA
ncbi:Ricin-type beta-trefoil lectin domain-containing protein [Streptomyces sp. yr375]|uniref:RICIN domain-containing protein n=1 Tax=Streptomyces sp. yr375 TaxID=1761906 RepID=UPI0008BD3C04|nr:RICIN domain-containing protein [Streptomyces sp. yr375]SEP73395.1 Ricin-type beta-trefoil lectin domain-containing protein [Streptomyces sp. yr375]